MTQALDNIIKYMCQRFRMDCSGYRPDMLEHRITSRAAAAGKKDLREYLIYLRQEPKELDDLLGSITINTSLFFREPLTFEYLARRLLPDLLDTKDAAGEKTLRIWSAGCAEGEEAYSIAILVNEAVQKAKALLEPAIFATDISSKSLFAARQGIYPSDRLNNIRYGLLKKYFDHDNQTFEISTEIKEKVHFSFYDILEAKTYTPPESIFGDFDLVFCCNVLIYFSTSYQEIIFDKLYRSLAPSGYLVLGESETPPAKYDQAFIPVHNCGHIYQKSR